MMEDEEGYTTLNLRPKPDGSAGPSPAEKQGARQSPRWPLVILGVGNIILAVTVLLLIVYVVHVVSEKRQKLAVPDCDSAEREETSTTPDCADVWSGDTSLAECSSCREHFRSQLIQSLCRQAQPSPAEGSGCKLCPTDWRLHGDKCYWVSRDRKTWNKSRANCSARLSQLLVIQDPEELESLKDLTQGINQFWVGLSHSPEKGWTWLDGSQLDHTLFQLSGWAETSPCGMVTGNWIRLERCRSTYHWICQQDAVPL